MIDFEIISTGSQGNAVIIKNSILIDCGVSFKKLKPFHKSLKLVLLTHIHSDHFNKTALRMLAKERPALRFACCNWLKQPLIDCGIKANVIDVLKCDYEYNYGPYSVIPVKLVHDVPNCGYKIHFSSNNEKMFYATDTGSLNGITAPNYDLFLIEANYENEVIQEKIRDKKSLGEFAYEKRVLKTHLSKAQCDNFIYSNISSNGVYVYMHCHRDENDDKADVI